MSATVCASGVYLVSLLTQSPLSPHSLLFQDLRGSIVRICQFLGKDLDDAAIDSVVANASFGAMKSNKMSNFSLSPRFLMNQKKSPFLRKGDQEQGDRWVGGWTPVTNSSYFFDTDILDPVS